MGSVAEMSANENFIARHLAHRWLDIASLPRWPGHNGALLAEARSRGLATEPDGRSWLFFRDGACVGGFTGTRNTSLTGALAWDIAQYKDRTKTLLEASGIPVPNGAVFPADDLSAAEDHVGRLGGRRAVVKPVDGAGGRGITTDITGPGELAAAWQRARSESRAGRILVEEQVSGVDVRVYVVGGSPVAATARIPPHVVGDGSATLDQLTERLRTARSGHGYLARSLEPDPDYLSRAGVDGATVLAADRIQLLNGTGNISQGGVNVDLTDDLHPDLLALAGAAARALPNLGTGGVDLLIRDVDVVEGAVVTEVNGGANLSVNQFPGFGRPRDVAGAIVAEMLRRADSSAGGAGGAASPAPSRSG